jgi:hypothetical protein
MLYIYIYPYNNINLGHLLILFNIHNCFVIVTYGVTWFTFGIKENGGR